MMEIAGHEVGGAIGEGIVDLGNFLSALATAIFGGMVAMRIQFMFRETGTIHVRWSAAFWIASAFALFTIGLAFAIAGLKIELTPVLYAFPFFAGMEFSAHDFEGTRIGQLKWYSRVQLVTFFLLVVFGGAFLVRNLVGRQTRPMED